MALLVGAVIATSLASVVPTAARRIDIGPDGFNIDPHSQRECDFRRDDDRRDRDADDRRQRFGDDRLVRRGYWY